MIKFGWVMLIASYVFSVCCSYGGSNPFLQFISAAAPWVVMGIGIACIMVPV